MIAALFLLLTAALPAVAQEPEPDEEQRLVAGVVRVLLNNPGMEIPADGPSEPAATLPLRRALAVIELMPHNLDPERLPTIGDLFQATSGVEPRRSGHLPPVRIGQPRCPSQDHRRHQSQRPLVGSHRLACGWYPCLR